MSPPTALRVENAAKIALSVIEYFCYCIIFGAIAVLWVVTS